MAVLSNTELAELLEWAAGRVRAGDSFEGSVAWTFTDSGDGNAVTAAIRYDNLNGQGCMRIVEYTCPDDACENHNACRHCGSEIPDGRTVCGALECGGGELPVTHPHPRG